MSASHSWVRALRANGWAIAALFVLAFQPANAAQPKASTGRITKAATQSSPEVRSKAVLVLDAGSGDVLFARNANSALSIASLTKLMTALVVIESRQSLDEVITVTREDRDGARGAASRLTVGAVLTRGDLMHLALMASDNRAAYALARTYPGGKPAFVAAMNAKARILGMTQTRFVDPSGLSAGNVACAADIAKLILAVSEHAAIREYSTDGNHSVTLVKQAIEFRNTNYLVTKADWDIQVQKTGYTSDAGQCLAMRTVIQNRSVVIVLLDSFGKHTRTADARRIRRWLESHPTQTIARS